jgi:hypothetical protein
MPTHEERKKFIAVGVMLRKMTPTEREPILQKCITEHVNKVLASHGLSREQLTPEQLTKAETDTRNALIKEWKLDARE